MMRRGIRGVRALPKRDRWHMLQDIFGGKFRGKSDIASCSVRLRLKISLMIMDFHIYVWILYIYIYINIYYT